MTNEQFQRIMAGEISQVFIPDDYIGAIASDTEREAVQRFFSRVNHYLNFLTNLYCINSDSPTLHIDTTKKVAARAKMKSSGGAQIIISRGLLDHLEKLREKPIVVEGDDAIVVLEGDHASELAAFWIVAHEYFHYARGHLYFPKDEREAYSWGFEYDADNLATAALYRWSSKIWNIERFTRKQFSYIAAFWCLRTLHEAQSTKAERSTHPDWQERLLMLQFKLAHMGFPHPNSHGRPPELLREEDRMTMLAYGCEQFFLSQSESIYSSFTDWQLNTMDRRLKENDIAAAQWEKIRAKVADYDLIKWPS